MFSLSYLTALIAATHGVLAIPSFSITSHPLNKRFINAPLLQNASGIELRYVYYIAHDNDGCIQTAAIGADGEISKGVEPHFGDLAHDYCHDDGTRDHSNTYSRAVWDKDFGAVLYDAFYDKNQRLDRLAGGQKYEFESVVVFFRRDTGAIIKVAITAKGGHWEVKLPDQIVMYDTFDVSSKHPMIVYHKPGGVAEHQLRFATESDKNDEKKQFMTSLLVGWDGWPEIALRNKFTDPNAFEGKARPRVSDGLFETAIKEANDAGGPDVPLNPDPKKSCYPPLEGEDGYPAPGSMIAQLQPVAAAAK